MNHYVGIDISKRDFHVCLDEESDIQKFLNDRAGIKQFLRYLKAQQCQIEDTLIGLESTGSYHLAVSYLVTEYGYTVHVINPLITKRQNQTSLRRVKTDEKDARLIRYCLVNGAGYPFRETADTIALKSLVRQRAQFSMLRHRTRLKHEEISEREKHFGNKITNVNRELQEFLDGKIRELDAVLRTYNPKMQKLLQSIPGIGPQTAVTCVSEIGEIGRFSDPQKLVAWVGLDSRVHLSGTSIRGKGYISKRGNKILRTRLFNAASVAVIHPPNLFSEFFQKKRSEGKPYRVALCAVMRKMVHVIYAVWTRGTPFVQ